ncbi:MAG: tRNA epoxyqueuosine(34) reductase QueG [Dehalococcoidia bacterium]|nr:tRNA epoxyqueuosine(34) reductase QueG [Dehalococcoidia bacterium]
MSELERKVKSLALSLGFDRVGITDSAPFDRDEIAADQRVRDGLMDGLPWYTEERVHRMNRPELLLEDARSVISMAANYNTGPPPGESDDPEVLRGRVARYAWGRDYHNVIKGRLRRFVRELPDVVGRPVHTRYFVDDGPMNDRAAAERSGVGWFGKNTNILTPTHGSWVFLAQVVTDLDLKPDPPLKKTCGECIRCIPACPTDAIVAPYVIDNRKCISFLTIELRGPIPREMRPMMGDWVFGCDICQEVCPVNRKAILSGEPDFDKRHDFDAPELIPLLDLDDATFRKRFEGSPIRRAKREGLQRNVCVALGNIGDPVAVPALAAALNSDSQLVRSHAAWALGKIGGDEARVALERALEDEEDEGVREEIVSALE